MANPAHQELAGWLLAREIGERDGTIAEVEAAELTFQKLSNRLAKLVTYAGCQAILARALRLAKMGFPFLEGVRPGAQPESCLEGLRDSAEGLEPAQIRGGMATLLAGLLGLLATFIGDELVLRMVRDVWPEARLGEAAAGVKEADA